MSLGQRAQSCRPRVTSAEYHALGLAPPTSRRTESTICSRHGAASSWVSERASECMLGQQGGSHRGSRGLRPAPEGSREGASRVFWSRRMCGSLAGLSPQEGGMASDIRVTSCGIGRSPQPRMPVLVLTCVASRPSEPLVYGLWLLQHDCHRHGLKVVWRAVIQSPAQGWWAEEEQVIVA